MIFNIYKFCSKYLYFIIGLVFVINFSIQSNGYSFLDGETGLIEILQVFFISLSFLIIYNNKKLFRDFYKRLIVNFKFLFISFLLYEELSFLTAYKFDFANQLNSQSEINFHNSYFFSSLSFNIPFLSEDVYFSTILKILIVIFISFGAEFKFLKKLRFFFFEKEFSFFGYIYLLNFLLSPIMRYFDLPLANTAQAQIIDDELIELMFYFLLFLDSFKKRIIIKNI